MIPIPSSPSSLVHISSNCYSRLLIYDTFRYNYTALQLSAARHAYQYSIRFAFIRESVSVRNGTVMVIDWWSARAHMPTRIVLQWEANVYKAVAMRMVLNESVMCI